MNKSIVAVAVATTLISTAASAAVFGDQTASTDYDKAQDAAITATQTIVNHAYDRTQVLESHAVDADKTLADHETRLAQNEHGVNENANDIANETAARTAADAGLQKQVDANTQQIASSAGGVAKNAADIADEAAARQAADAGLQTDVADNKADADNKFKIINDASAQRARVVDGKLADEATARQAGD
ncbi:hypothetical protein IFY47_003414, partial [Salmonella enterica]|nr:hypothetical protein [Salmonella enterica]